MYDTETTAIILDHSEELIVEQARRPTPASRINIREVHPTEHWPQAAQMPSLSDDRAQHYTAARPQIITIGPISIIHEFLRVAVMYSI